MLTKEQIEEFRAIEETTDGMDAARALLAEREELIGLLREVEWSGSGPSGYARFCPACPGESTNGHHPSCRLAAYLR
jgi:hypothetical protein